VTGELQDLHSKVDQVLTILRGGYDSNGQWTAGVSPRLDDHERRLGELEGTKGRQLNWGMALILSTVGAAIGQALSWTKDHIK
jgi:hypothetical protein